MRRNRQRGAGQFSAALAAVPARARGDRPARAGARDRRGAVAGNRRAATVPAGDPSLRAGPGVTRDDGSRVVGQGPGGAGCLPQTCARLSPRWPAARWRALPGPAAIGPAGRPRQRQSWGDGMSARWRSSAGAAARLAGVVRPVGHRLPGRRGAVMLNVALLAVAAVLGGVIYYAYRPAAAAAAPVSYVTVQRGTVQATISASGNARPARDASVNFQTSGRVSEIDVRVGQHVRAGQLLARLDATLAELNLQAAEDSLAAAEAALSAATSGRSSSGQSGGSSSGRSGNGASSAAGQVESDEASVASDQASVLSAEQALAQTRLTAPAAGTVAAVNGSVGQSVSGGGATSASGSSSNTSSGSGSSGGGSSSSSSSSGSGSGSGSSTAFIELVQQVPLKVTAYFDEADAVKVRVGQRAVVTFDALPGRTAR